MNLVKLKRISFVISTISLCYTMASCKKEEKPSPSWVLDFYYDEKYEMGNVHLGIAFGIERIQHLSSLNNYSLAPDPTQKLLLEVYNNKNSENKHILYTDEGITNFYVYELTSSGEKIFSFQKDFLIPSEMFVDNSGSITIVFNIYIRDELSEYYGKALKYAVSDNYVSLFPANSIIAAISY